MAHNADKQINEVINHGPDYVPLQSQSWRIKGLSKLKYFIWQVFSDCLAVNDNLRNRGINCETQCPRCGMKGETINHDMFECHVLLQTWVLSKISSTPYIFPSSLDFMNIDYLFWRVPYEVFGD